MSQRYLISNAEHDPIAQAELESASHSETIHLNILNGKAELVEQAGDICAIGIDDEHAGFRARVGYRYGDCVVVARYAKLDASERRNLRVRTDFESYLYPVSGEWHGRRSFTCKDLSCGGIAFQTSQPLEVGEIVEVVLAPMKYPLLVHTQILRPLAPGADGKPVYASKFVNLCADEDAAIQKSVFSIQLRNR